MTTHSDILDKFGSRKKLYDLLTYLGYDFCQSTVYGWKRNGVPSDWWPRIERAGESAKPKVKVKAQDFILTSGKGKADV